MRRFEEFHPAVIAVFYLAVILPVALIVDIRLSMGTLFAGLAYTGMRGKKMPAGELVFSFQCILLMTVVNAIVNGKGETVLFFISGRAVTKESVLYGMVTGVMLAAILIWFRNFNKDCGGGKMLQIFGRFRKLGLLVSMVLRLVPDYVTRYKETVNVIQVNEPEDSERGTTIRGILATFTWAFEQSMEQATVMTRRGYDENKGRLVSSPFRRRDYVLLAVILVMQGMYALPILPRMIANVVFAMIPVLYLVKEEIKWALYIMKRNV